MAKQKQASHPPPAVDIASQVAATWRVHNDINVFLIGKIPKAGFDAVPPGSRGRTVAEQLSHMNQVRIGWLQYHQTGERPDLAAGFLLRRHPTFGPACARIVAETAAGRLRGEALESAVGSAVAPVDVGGWCDPAGGPVRMTRRASGGRCACQNRTPRCSRTSGRRPSSPRSCRRRCSTTWR